MSNRYPVIKKARVKFLELAEIMYKIFLRSIDPKKKICARLFRMGKNRLCGECKITICINTDFKSIDRYYKIQNN